MITILIESVDYPLLSWHKLQSHLGKTFKYTIHHQLLLYKHMHYYVISVLVYCICWLKLCLLVRMCLLHVCVCIYSTTSLVVYCQVVSQCVSLCCWLYSCNVVMFVSVCSLMSFLCFFIIVKIMSASVWMILWLVLLVDWIRGVRRSFSHMWVPLSLSLSLSLSSLLLPPPPLSLLRLILLLISKRKTMIAWTMKLIATGPRYWPSHTSLTS